MAANHIIVRINEYWMCLAKRLQTAFQFSDLRPFMQAGVIRVKTQIEDVAPIGRVTA